MRWTAEQEEILFNFGHKGAHYCAELIAKKFHVRRSAGATQRHASRIGAPMMKYEICPQCGKPVEKLNRSTGLCATCNYHRLYMDEAERTAKIRKQLEEGEDEEKTHEERRKYNAQRKRNERLKKYGDFANLSVRMSRPWSEAQEIFSQGPKNECARA